MPPKTLTKLSSVVVSGNVSNWSDHVTRISKSVSEDICSALTAAKWKMPKHCLLEVDIHWSLIMLNCIGQCRNSLVKELETAMANSLKLQDTVLPSHMSVLETN